MINKPVQRIRYLQTPDGIRLAWAEAGSGPPLIKAANWMSHLEYEWESPVWKHWMQFFAGNFRFIRYDERGCGMTQWSAGDLSLESWMNDLESVRVAAEPAEPFILMGISQGAAACVKYAVENPEKVSHLILYGGYARGAAKRDDPVKESVYRAMIDLVRVGWGSDNPTFRQVFTSRFIPGGTDEQLQWFNELCRKTTSGEIAAKILEMRSSIDITGLLGKIRTPTLILHSSNDDVIPISEGHILAAGIPKAEFVELDSKNHVLLEAEPAWKRFCSEVLRFTRPDGTSAETEDPAFAELTVREREVLRLIAEGLSNAAIGERLSISEKTVRNHVSNIFDKLGVWSRAQAIVFVRDHTFGAGSKPGEN